MKRRLAGVALLHFLPVVVHSAQGAHLLNVPQAVTHPADVLNTAVAPGGTRVIYVDSPALNIWSVPIDGGAPVRLNTSSTSRNITPAFKFAPGSRRVLFRAAFFPEEPFPFSLCSAPIDGSAGDVNLGSFVLPDYRVAPDGQTVVYRSQSEASAPAHLVFTRSDQFTSRSLADGVTGFRILPDSAHVVYRTERGPGRFELFQVPMVFRATPQPIGEGIVDVQPEFELTPDGSTVLFRADLGSMARSIWSRRRRSLQEPRAS